MALPGTVVTAGVIDALFDDFDGYLKTQGYQAMGGQIIDASIVAVPKQRNNRADNTQIKQGETPREWADKAARRRQKDGCAVDEKARQAVCGRTAPSGRKTLRRRSRKRV